MPSLILYTRVGCCLCEGLEERLRELLPADALRLVDVDGDPALQARYGLSVPVLALATDPRGDSRDATSRAADSREEANRAADSQEESTGAAGNRTADSGEGVSGEGASGEGASGAAGSPGGLTPLPPVPPRLKGEQLRAWLQRHAGL